MRRGAAPRSELDYLKKATDDPVRPLVAIIGGAKVSDKIGVLERLTEKVDKLIIGGGMAFTFLKALGYEVGKSLCEQEMLDVAEDIMAKASERHVKFYLPVDCVVAQPPRRRRNKVRNRAGDPEGVDGPRYRAGIDDALRRGPC